MNSSPALGAAPARAMCVYQQLLRVLSSAAPALRGFPWGGCWEQGERLADAFGDTNVAQSGQSHLAAPLRYLFPQDSVETVFTQVLRRDFGSKTI